METDLSKGLKAIAVTMQVPLSYLGGTLSGSRTVFIPVSVGGHLPVTVKPKKLMVNGTVAVLFHVARHLYLIASYFPPSGSVSLYYIDGEVLEMDGVRTPPELFLSKTMTLRAALSALKKGLVSSFFHRNGAWKPLSLTNTL